MREEVLRYPARMHHIVKENSQYPGVSWREVYIHEVEDSEMIRVQASKEQEVSEFYLYG